MTTFDIIEDGGTWFDLEGGGRIQLRTVSPEIFRQINRRCVKKRVDFKKVDGTPGRFEYEEVNDDLKNELFWDDCIVSWENLFDGKGNEIPCTKENKIVLMNLRSGKFRSFVADCLKVLTEMEAEQAEVASKN